MSYNVLCFSYNFLKLFKTRSRNNPKTRGNLTELVDAWCLMAHGSWLMPRSCVPFTAASHEPWVTEQQFGTAPPCEEPPGCEGSSLILCSNVSCIRCILSFVSRLLKTSKLGPRISWIGFRDSGIVVNKSGDEQSSVHPWKCVPMYTKMIENGTWSHGNSGFCESCFLGYL